MACCRILFERLFSDSLKGSYQLKSQTDFVHPYRGITLHFVWCFDFVVDASRVDSSGRVVDVFSNSQVGS